MWLVLAALRHPYAVWVGMLLVTAFGVLSYHRTPTDILPTLKVPVVVVFSSYRGMPPPDMEQTVTAILERALTKCDHLDRIESRSLLGISIIQVYFRPNVNGHVASSQVSALVAGELQNLPPGMLPPTIFNYDASSIPVGNLVISSKSRDDKFLLDFADHELRDELAGIDGLASAPVFGGAFRQIQIYVQPRTLAALKMSPLDVARKVNLQSQVLPTGEIRILTSNFTVRSNSMAKSVAELTNIPIYNDGRKIVKLGDVADIVDGTRWRTNTVRVDGKRAVYMPLFRQAGASAVTVVDNVQDFLVELRQRDGIPDDVEVEVAFDQSQYVRDALSHLRTEAVLGAVLASLVVLLFLGSLRTTWIVALSIPLSLLTAFAGLYFTGETLNIMTLGGLALVLGRIVDDSVVDVENTVRHLGMGKTPFQAALDSASEISVPVFMATVVTTIVFAPLIFMTGMGKYLFTPLAVSVVLALFASYLVSRTVSPLFCSRYLRAPVRPESGRLEDHILAPERFPRWLFVTALLTAVGCLIAWLALTWAPIDLDKLSRTGLRAFRYGHDAVMVVGLASGVLVLTALVFWVAPTFERGFARFTRLYELALAQALRFRLLVLAGVGALAIPAFFAFRSTGQELFPDVDSSMFTLHMRATGGPRVEETERQIGAIEDMIRGYQATPAMLIQEVIRCRRLGEEDHLAAIRAENPGADGLIDRALQFHPDKAALKALAQEHEGRLFDVPGIVPPEDLVLMLSNIGISSRWSAIYTPNNGPHAAFVRVQLRSGFDGRTTTSATYAARVRDRVKKRFPTNDFFFETGGMIRNILNSGAVAPVEVQVFGRNHEQRREITQLLHREIAQVPGAEDAHSPQGIDLPQLTIVVDRVRASQADLTETDVIRNVITALMSSAQLAPNFWIDPQTGNPYILGVQYPEHVVNDIRTLEEIPVTPETWMARRAGPTRANGDTGLSPRFSARRPVVRLENVATIERGQGPVEVYHHAARRVSQLFVSVADQDLAGVTSDIEAKVRRFPLTWALHTLPPGKKHLADDPEFQSRLGRYFKRHSRRERAAIQERYGVDVKELDLPRDVRIQMRGEVQSMRQSFGEMAFSLVLAVVLVYLVMAAQFGSWIDPLVMIVAAPLGLVGVAFTLWITGTSLNIQSCMGVLMMVGISVSNSVLLVEFANRQRAAGLRTRAAVISAAGIRLRPILMTTIATLVGLAPMAFHFRPGDEMNIPLARAVIGGLAGSTLLTLFVVPILYVLLKPKLAPQTVAPSPSPEAQP
jgi:multidrug efflux pump subunit AcrB